MNPQKSPFSKGGLEGDFGRRLTMRNGACHSESKEEKQRNRGEIGPIADPLPDYFEYCDEGCDLFPSCLECPLPRCRYDDQAGGRRAATRLRDKALLRRRRLAGNNVAELAQSFGVSKRTVQRIIRRASSE